MNTRPIVGLLLAAGLSSRMGRPKALLDWQGAPLVRYQVEQLRLASCDSVIVVTGHDADGVRGALAGCEATLVDNPLFRDGRATSVRAGACAVQGSPTALVVLSVDQPRSAEIVRRLLDAHLSGSALLTVPRYGDRRGHPMILDGSLLEELTEVSEEDQGLKAVVRRHAQQRLEVAFDTDEVLLDLNTPEAYASASARLLPRANQVAETEA